MDNKRERLNISVSFTNEDRVIYEFTKNKPNSSHYIKELIREDIAKEKQKNTYTIQEIDTNDIESMLF